MIEIAALATSVVSSFLVPLIKNGAEGLLDEVRTRATDAAAGGLVETAKRLWARLRGETAETDDSEVVELFERKPDLMRGPLEEVLRSLMERNPDFHREVSELLEAKDEGGQSRWQLMGEIVGVVDARHATLSGNASISGVTYNAATGSAARSTAVGTESARVPGD